MRGHRKERINEVIKRVVSKSIITEVRDPRVGFVTVTKVRVDDDLRSARVYVTIMGEQQDKKLSIKALNQMGGFLQKDLGKSLMTRNTPILEFELDEGTEESFKISSLIEEARATDIKHDESQ